MTARIATAADEQVVVDIFVRSFFNDPLWGWVFTDPSTRAERQHVIWQLCFEGAQRYPWTFLNENGTSAAMWIPPNGTEFDAEQEQRMEHAMVELFGEDVGRVNGTFELFDAHHPRHVPHFYLSLLGTHPDHLGHGFGLSLLAENLAAIDETGAPAYLEASHMGNVPIYQRYGFEPVVAFNGPSGGPTVTAMWRIGRSGIEWTDRSLQGE